MITADQLLDRSVVVRGHLGVPLGQVVEIEARVVDGTSLPETEQFAADRASMPQASFFLSVEKVDGQRLPIPQVMRFSIMTSGNVRMGADILELRKRIGALVASHEMTQSDADRAIASFVGSRVRLLAYEAAVFNGAPDPRKYSYPAVSVPKAFGFDPFLVLLHDPAIPVDPAAS